MLLDACCFSIAAVAEVPRDPRHALAVISERGLGVREERRTG